MLKDRYRMDEVLGSNGISITYLAFDTFREKKIVVKELFPEAMVERNPSDRITVSCSMVHEGEFARMKEHMMVEAKKLIKLYPLKGIANVITFFEENKTVYVVIEYVEGISLPEHMKKIHMPRILLKDAFKLIKPVVASLERVHSKGVVHGKINPSLIRITETGEPVLLGFCDPMEDASIAILEDATARVSGYSPVEQYVEGGRIMPSVDIYAVAAILYEMTTGHKVPAFYERMSEENPEGRDILVPPSYYNGSIMDYQSKALLKALAIYDFDRYQNLNEFVQAISEEEFAPEYQIRMREKPLLMVRVQKYRMLFMGIFVVGMLFFAVFFIPKGLRFATSTGAERFYQKLEQATLYEQCEMIAGLSERKRSSYANDYTQMDEEGEHAIYYYDKITGRYLSREGLDLNRDMVRFITLDYRLNGSAILTIVEDGRKRELTINLKPNAAGEYAVSEKVTGTEEEDGLSNYLVGPE
ncbi:MAG: protein kinase [Lachnospiraceae bacterium]|nr:protein kinase [Lachnospiraceae bacterium]